MWKEENYYYYVIVFNINTKLATFIKDIGKIFNSIQYFIPKLSRNIWN